MHSAMLATRLKRFKKTGSAHIPMRRTGFFKMRRRTPPFAIQKAPSSF